MIENVSAQGDQVVYEYLSRVSDAGMRVLTPERRVQLIANLRRSIDEARRKDRADSADAVRRLLKRFGDPTAIVNVAADRSGGAVRRSQPRMPGPGDRPPLGAVQTAPSPAPEPRTPKMPSPASLPPGPAAASTSPSMPAASSHAGRRAARPRRPQQPHTDGARSGHHAASGAATGPAGTGTRPGGPPLPPITKLRAFDPDKVRFWARGQMNSGTRLDLLSLFVLGVASLLLPILGFIGGAVMVHSTKAYKTEDELVAFAAIPVLGFVLMMALRWPNDPSFTETMTALADALAGATAIGGVVGAGYLWSRQGLRAASATTVIRPAQPTAPGSPGGSPQPNQPRQPRQPGQSARPAQPGQPRPVQGGQPSAQRPPEGLRRPGQPRPSRPSGLGALGQSGSRRQGGQFGALSQWFPPRRPR